MREFVRLVLGMFLRFIGILHGIKLLPKPSLNLQGIARMVDIRYQILEAFHPNSSFFFTQCHDRQRPQFELCSIENHKALFHLNFLALFRPFFKVLGAFAPPDLFDLAQLDCPLIVRPGAGWCTPRDLKTYIFVVIIAIMFITKFITCLVSLLSVKVFFSGRFRE